MKSRELILSLSLLLFMGGAYYLGLEAGKSIGIEKALLHPEFRAHDQLANRQPIVESKESVPTEPKEAREPKARLEFPTPPPSTEKEVESIVLNPKIAARGADNELERLLEEKKRVLESKKGETKEEAKLVFPEAKNLAIRKDNAKAVPAGWYSQVWASNTEDEASRLANKLKRSGFPVVIEAAAISSTSRSNGSSIYRVLVGPEATRDLAQELLNQLEREKYLETKPFIRLITK
jgi:cell division protein FtsN